MSDVLCTFSGKYGDILWSLATARSVSNIVGVAVDFATMPMYASLIPLLEAQSYISKAFTIEDWQLVHSNHGDQPWHPPVYIDKKYTRTWHLGYKAHPGISAPEMSLLEFVAYQQGIAFRPDHPPVPFIETDKIEWEKTSTAAANYEICNEQARLIRGAGWFTYAFNSQYDDLKQKFLSELKARLPHMLSLDVSKYSWAEAAKLIAASDCFVGCRSANFVLASGVNKKIYTYEPHPSRNRHGHLGRVFGCPYTREWSQPFNVVPEAQAEYASKLIQEWINEEHHNETN